MKAWQVLKKYDLSWLLQLMLNKVAWDQMNVYQTLRKITRFGDQLSLIIIVQWERIECDIFSGKHSTLGPPWSKDPLCCWWTDGTWQAGVWIWRPGVLVWMKQELTDLTCGTINPRCSPKGKKNFLSVTYPFKMNPMAYALQLFSSVRGSNASWVLFCQKK